MIRLPQIAWLADGKRLHLQDGPIDLIVEAKGNRNNVRSAYEAAAGRLTAYWTNCVPNLASFARPPIRRTRI